jgi:hypothetical protein
MKMAVGMDAIRNNPKLYIGDCEPSRQILGTELAGCALTSGARCVQIELLTDGWVSVIVSTFSRSLGLKSGDTWITALGDEPPEPVRKCVANAEFAAVFKPLSVNVSNRGG